MASPATDILAHITAYKLEEIAAAKAARPLAQVMQVARMLSSDSEPRREQDHVPPLAEGHQAVLPKG